jgi:hypothetical protein
VSVQEAARRKPDESREYLYSHARLLDDGALHWGLCRLDSEADVSVVSDRLVREVLATYFDGWRTPTHRPTRSHEQADPMSE